MKLHTLPSTHKRTQRIGRGGKRGHTAGRGTKGQHSRAGRRQRPAERDLIMRIPKLRGFRNKPKRDPSRVFSLEDLAAVLTLSAKGKVPVEITEEFLKVAGLLEKNFKGTIKILSDGEITVAVNVHGIKTSKVAQQKIEKAGGKVIL